MKTWKPWRRIICPSQSYRTPTSELKIWWQQSSITTWAEKPIATNLYFCLKLGKQSIEGDRLELGKLTTSIERYTQELLTSNHIHSFSHQLKIDQSKSIEIGTLELFDLLTSLEQLEQDLALLPPLPSVPLISINQPKTNRPPISLLNNLPVQKLIHSVQTTYQTTFQNYFTKIPAWAKVGTTVATGVGLSLGLMQLFMPSRISPVSNQIEQPIALAPKPKIVTPQRLPSFLAKPRPSSTARPIKILPPIPTPPAIPDPAPIAPSVAIAETPPPPKISEAEQQLLGDLKGEFKMADIGKNDKTEKSEVESLNQNAARQARTDQARSNQPLVLTSNVTLEKIEQLERRENPIDLNFSLSQHLRRQVSSSDRSPKGEVEYVVNMVNGQISEVQFDRSSLGDNGIEQSIGNAISSWQVPGNPSGRARLTVKIW